MKTQATNYSVKEKGASLVEYALLLGLLTVVCLSAIKILGQSVSTQFSSTASLVNEST